MRNDLTSDSGSLVYAVSGMHCRSCAANVGDFVEEVEGAHDVAVDLETGRLTVRGDVDDTAVRDAVAAAGYSAERVE